MKLSKKLLKSVAFVTVLTFTFSNAALVNGSVSPISVILDKPDFVPGRLVQNSTGAPGTVKSELRQLLGLPPIDTRSELRTSAVAEMPRPAFVTTTTRGFFTSIANFIQTFIGRGRKNRLPQEINQSYRMEVNGQAHKWTDQSVIDQIRLKLRDSGFKSEFKLRLRSAGFRSFLARLDSLENVKEDEKMKLIVRILREDSEKYDELLGSLNQIENLSASAIRAVVTQFARKYNRVGKYGTPTRLITQARIAEILNDENLDGLPSDVRSELRAKNAGDETLFKLRGGVGRHQREFFLSHEDVKQLYRRFRDYELRNVSSGILKSTEDADSRFPNENVFRQIFQTALRTRTLREEPTEKAPASIKNILRGKIEADLGFQNFASYSVSILGQDRESLGGIESVYLTVNLITNRVDVISIQTAGRNAPSITLDLTVRRQAIDAESESEEEPQNVDQLRSHARKLAKFIQQLITENEAENITIYRGGFFEVGQRGQLLDVAASDPLRIAITEYFKSIQKLQITEQPSFIVIENKMSLAGLIEALAFVASSREKVHHNDRFSTERSIITFEGIDKANTHEAHLLEQLFKRDMIKKAKSPLGVIRISPAITKVETEYSLLFAENAAKKILSDRGQRNQLAKAIAKLWSSPETGNKHFDLGNNIHAIHFSGAAGSGSQRVFYVFNKKDRTITVLDFLHVDQQSRRSIDSTTSQMATSQQVAHLLSELKIERANARSELRSLAAGETRQIQKPFTQEEYDTLIQIALTRVRSGLVERDKLFNYFRDLLGEQQIGERNINLARLVNGVLGQLPPIDTRITDTGAVSYTEDEIPIATLEQLRLRAITHLEAEIAALNQRGKEYDFPMIEDPEYWSDELGLNDIGQGHAVADLIAQAGQYLQTDTASVPYAKESDLAYLRRIVSALHNISHDTSGDGSKSELRLVQTNLAGTVLPVSVRERLPNAIYGADARASQVDISPAQVRDLILDFLGVSEAELANQNATFFMTDEVVTGLQDGEDAKPVALILKQIIETVQKQIVIERATESTALIVQTVNDLLEQDGLGRFSIIMVDQIHNAPKVLRSMDISEIKIVASDSERNRATQLRYLFDNSEYNLGVWGERDIVFVEKENIVELYSVFNITSDLIQEFRSELRIAVSA